MTRLFKYPMHINDLGHFETVEDGEESYVQEIAMMIQTVPGERHLVPEYGIEELTFSDFQQLEIEAQINMFGPPVDIESTEVITEPSGTMVRVEFTPIQDENIYEDEEYLSEGDSSSFMEATESY